MFCSKKSIRLSKQPFYEHRSDMSMSVSLVDKEGTPEVDEKSLSDIENKEPTNELSPIPKLEIGATLQMEKNKTINLLIGNLCAWFKLESQYSFVSKYHIISKALDWGRSCSVVSDNDKIDGTPVTKWVKALIRSQNLDIKNQAFSQRHKASNVTNESEKEDNEDTDGSVDNQIPTENGIEQNYEFEIIENGHESPTMKCDTFDEAKQDLEDWFASESSNRYLLLRTCMSSKTNVFTFLKIHNSS